MPEAAIAPATPETATARFAAQVPPTRGFTTPRFGMTLPDYDDPADVRVLTAAFETLDAHAAHLGAQNTFTGTNTFAGPTYLAQPALLDAHPTNAMDMATKGYVDGLPRGLVWPLRGPADSAAAPNYSFAASPGTGMFSPGPNRLAFATNGLQRWEIDADGNLRASANCGINMQDTAVSGTYQGIRIGGATAGTGQAFNLPQNGSLGWRSADGVGTCTIGVSNGILVLNGPWRTRGTTTISVTAGDTVRLNTNLNASWWLLML